VTQLGMLVNSAERLPHVVGLTRAALAAGRRVAIFVMDEATRLLEDPAFTALSELDGVTVSVCEHSAKAFGVVPERVAGRIRFGSQLNNAAMVGGSDRVIVL
jgi:predicted peroxiredoxin